MAGMDETLLNDMVQAALGAGADAAGEPDPEQVAVARSLQRHEQPAP